MNKLDMDEEDDDLESLRLAALQSLQKKATASFDLVPLRPREHVQPKMYSPTHRRGRGGFHQNNRGRNGIFNNHIARTRNPNLISIPTDVESSPPKVDPPKGRSLFIAEKDTFKLSLPQDRYCNKTVEKETKDQISSKFSRYDNSDDSDDSESEEDDESEESDSESTGLHKAGSLEALMEELENEIKGKSSVPKTESNTIKAPKAKRRSKRVRTRTDSGTTEKDLLQAGLDTEPINSPEHLDIAPTILDVDLTSEDNDKIDNTKIKVKSDPEPEALPNEEERKVPQNLLKFESRDIHKLSPPRTMMRNRSPPPLYQPNSPPYRQHQNHPQMHHPRSNHNSGNNYNNFHNFNLQQQLPPHQMPLFGPPYNNIPFPSFPPSIIHQQPPPFLTRPLSPLAINTEALCTIAKAPLSPRSAAFVLQNREIIAQRRRKSPKRGFSRSVSRSPSPRRSLSPISRRSLSKSPIRNRGRSRSPLPPRRLSPPTRGGRNNSPPRRRKSMSPGNVRRHNNRKPMRERRSPPPPSKPSVRDRLGIRSRENTAKVEKPSQPEENLPPKTVVEESVPEDPILEARKRKFERTEISVKDGGVIKLKKEDEHQQEHPTSKTDLIDIDEDALLLEDDILSDSKINDIFSDDQSDDENEGRFKTADKTTVQLPGISSKSLNGTRDIKIEPLIKERPYKRADQVDRKRRRRSLSPAVNELDSETNSAISNPHLKRPAIRLTKLSKKVLNARVISPIENKKIEIKIRNPAKYEEQTSRSMYDVATEDEMRRTDENTQRGKKERHIDVVPTEDNEELVMEEVDLEPGVVDDAEDGELQKVNDDSVNNKCSDGGDLRAQLSRKRAERQNKRPNAEAIQSRLLQTALKDAGFKKVKKSKKSKHRDSALKELDNALLQQRVYCDNFYCKLTRLRLIEKEQELKENERVCVLYPEEKIPKSQDGKLPIHLRLGLAGSDVEIYAEHRKKSKKSKHRTLDQV